MKIQKSLFFGLIGLVFSIAPIFAQFTSTVVSISGTVKNAITKEPMTVYVVAYDQNGKKVNVARSNSSENGYYFLTGLKPGNTYQIVVEFSGFIREGYTLDIPLTTHYTEFSKDFALTPIAAGIMIPIPVPPFELNKSKLRFGSEDFIEPYVAEFVQNKKIKFEIVCYPDNANGGNGNMELTEERAKSLMSFFISKGVEPERIRIKGNANPDPMNPPPIEKRAKGKRYIGPTYLHILSIN